MCFSNYVPTYEIEIYIFFLKKGTLCQESPVSGKRFCDFLIFRDKNAKNK